MLPPIDDAVLQANPKFAILHANLTKNILNPNGSTKNYSSQRERDATTEALQKARIHSSKSAFIKSALTNLDISPPTTTQTSKSKPTSTSSTSSTPTPPTLPTELLELILLLSARLTTQHIPPNQLALLESTPQWASLPTHLPLLSTLLSTHLQTLALSLVRIHTPTTNPSYIHRSISKLVPSIRTLLTTISTQKTTLSYRRISLVSKTTTLLSLYHLSHTLLILSLEQSKHGLLSRHMRSRAEYLALSGTQVSLQSREKLVKGEKMVYSEEVRGALEGYGAHLRDARGRLGERGSDAERVLWGYGVGREEGEGDREKERVMRSVAGKYGELVRELGEVGRDVERLRDQ